MKIKKKNRKYCVGSTKIRDVANIVLKNNEQITLMENNKDFQYDICKKDWGYYALPSLNWRLKKFNLKTYIVNDCKNNKLFIHLVKKSKLKKHEKYLKSQNMKIIDWPKKILKKLNSD
jgi:hypothetical protein